MVGRDKLYIGLVWKTLMCAQHFVVLLDNYNNLNC